MKVCIISKFPPIQGGIASKIYWLSMSLAEHGIEVHVVTNSCAVGKEYRIKKSDLEQNLPNNVFVHNTDDSVPWHIPNSPLFQERLLDKVLSVFKEHRFDLIDSTYLVPYGITAYLAHKILGVPYIIRHGGSDISKFWKKGLLREILSDVIKQATAVVTDIEDFQSLNDNCINLARYVPDPRYFFPAIRPSDKPITFAYVGKINFLWQHKGLNDIMAFWKKNSFPQARLVFLSQGKGKQDFINTFGLDDQLFRDFIPPWEMPAFLRDINYVFYPTRNNPIPDFSNLVVEAVACGARIISDDISALGCFEDFFSLQDCVVPMDTASFHPLPGSVSCSGLKKRFENYITANLQLYDQITGNSTLKSLLETACSTEDTMEIDELWERLKSLEGEVFTQIRGREFTFRITNSYIKPNTTNQNIPKSHFAKALERLPLTDTTKLRDLRGPSYIYAILTDPRLKP